jgi:formylglycine-generating enzyme required for sulfatase activity
MAAKSSGGFEDFDPYHKWLGIPKDERPPTLYQLLGISPTETDVEVISAAVDRQQAFVTQFQGGPHHDAAASILLELAEARSILLDHAKRRKYDKKLGDARQHVRRRFEGTGVLYGSSSQTVGEDNSIIRQFAGMVAILCVAFAVMAIFAFNVLPWAKQVEKPIGDRPLPEAKNDRGANEPAIDSFQPNSVWASVNPKRILTVIERSGVNFKANFELDDSSRNITGTVQNGTIEWFAKDAKAIKGDPGSNNHGTLIIGDLGNKIDFIVGTRGNQFGEFTLHQQLPAIMLAKSKMELPWPFTASQATALQDAFSRALGKNVVGKNSDGMQFVLIPPGKFMMGSPSGQKDAFPDQNQVEVTLTSPFWLGKTEVTQSQWQSVMGTAPWKGKEFVREGPDHAASYISWNNAQDFVKKLSVREGVTYRLPTEAEWEWSCRAGTSRSWSFGENESDLGRYAWYYEDGKNNEEYPHEVGQKLANPFGLYDMHGNVWEWCDDVKVDRLSGGTNPRITTEGPKRVIRGGSWDNSPRTSRSAFRGAFEPDNPFQSHGLRVVRDP